MAEMYNPVGWADTNPLLARFGARRLDSYGVNNQPQTAAPTSPAPSWGIPIPQPGAVAAPANNAGMDAAGLGAAGLGVAGLLATDTGQQALSKLPVVGGLFNGGGSAMPAIPSSLSSVPQGLTAANVAFNAAPHAFQPGLGMASSNLSGVPQGLGVNDVLFNGRPTATFGSNFTSALKPGFLNVGGAALAGLPSILQGDYGAGIGAGLGSYLGTAAGTAAGAGIGGALGNFLIPGLGGIAGSFLGKKLGGLFGGGGKKKFVKIGDEAASNMVQRAADASQFYTLTDADKDRLNFIMSVRGNLSGQRDQILADLPILNTNEMSFADENYRDLVLIGAYERDNPVNPVFRTVNDSLTFNAPAWQGT